jgi:hypothetical protein
MLLNLFSKDKINVICHYYLANLYFFTNYNAPNTLLYQTLTSNEERSRPGLTFSSFWLVSYVTGIRLRQTERKENPPTFSYLVDMRYNGANSQQLL